MEAIGIGDLHLSSFNGHGGWSKYTDGNSDTLILKEAQKAVDFARDQNIFNIFLYGDICDSPKMSYKAHLALYDFFSQNADMKFYVILGNHDRLASNESYGSSCDLLEKFSLSNVEIFSKPTLKKIDGAYVNFLPFPYSDWKDALNVCHIDVKGSTMDSGRPSQSEIDPKDYVIVAGHIHTAGSFKKVFYSGTLYQTNFGESEEKYFHRIYYKDSKNFEIDLIPNTPAIQLHTITVNSSKDLENLPSSPNHVYRLLINDGCDISPHAYAHLNVAVVKSFMSRKDLKEILNSDLEYVSTSDINTEEIFEEILSKYELSDEEKENIRNVRLKVLSK